jgi:hypothetical protein
LCSKFFGFAVSGSFFSLVETEEIFGMERAAKKFERKIKNQKNPVE